MSHDTPETVVREVDRQFYERELASFIPDRLFDAHCHLWHADHHTINAPGLPATAGYNEYQQLIDCLHPGRPVSSLFLPIPFSREIAASTNAWIAEQSALDPNGRGLFRKERRW